MNENTNSKIVVALLEEADARLCDSDYTDESSHSDGGSWGDQHNDSGQHSDAWNDLGDN